MGTPLAYPCDELERLPQQAAKPMPNAFCVGGNVQISSGPRRLSGHPMLHRALLLSRRTEAGDLQVEQRLTRNPGRLRSI